MDRSDVPQTTLKRLRAVVDACGRGATSPAEVETVTQISSRHVSYALSAACTLGLVVKSRGKAQLTELGKHLAHSMPGSEEERSALQKAITESHVLKVIAPGLLTDKPLTKDQIAKRIIDKTGLGEGTALHRAAMIFKWRRALNTKQVRLFNTRNQTMWRRIEIRNFRSISHTVVDLAPFTVVIGPNGSGKSNFADALVFARDIALDASTAISARGGIVGVRRWRPSKPTDVTIDIRASSTKQGLDRTYARHLFKIHSGRLGEWSFSHEDVEVREPGRKASTVKRREAQFESTPKLPIIINDTTSVMLTVRQFQHFGPTSALRNVRRYRLNSDAMRQPQIATEEYRLRESGDNIAAAIQAIAKSGQIGEVITPMAKIIPGLLNIYVQPVGRFQALKFTQRQESTAVADFNATEMSEGALRALGIIVATHQMVADELLIIEEPEVSLHVGAAHLLFQILKRASARGAVLLTTHSADLLDAARDEELLVCEYHDGETAIGELAQAQRAIVKEGLFSVAELMRSEPLRIESPHLPKKARKKGNRGT
jgi:predicted ATPase